MTSPFITHLLVALVWLFLSGDTTLANFLFALGVTFALLAVFRKPLRCEAYVRRTVALGRFMILLLVEIVASNLRLMIVALRRDASEIQGCFIPYGVDGMTNGEILLLSLCVGLSPGTIAVERHDDSKVLILHVYPASDLESVRRKTDAVLRRGILSFTR